MFDGTFGLRALCISYQTTHSVAIYVCMGHNTSSHGQGLMNTTLFMPNPFSGVIRIFTVSRIHPEVFSHHLWAVPYSGGHIQSSASISLYLQHPLLSHQLTPGFFFFFTTSINLPFALPPCTCLTAPALNLTVPLHVQIISICPLLLYFQNMHCHSAVPRGQAWFYQNISSAAHSVWLLSSHRPLPTTLDDC